MAVAKFVTNQLCFYFGFQILEINLILYDIYAKTEIYLKRATKCMVKTGLTFSNQPPIISKTAVSPSPSLPYRHHHLHAHRIIVVVIIVISSSFLCINIYILQVVLLDEPTTYVKLAYRSSLDIKIEMMLSIFVFISHYEILSIAP